MGKSNESNIQSYMGTKETSEHWGVSQTTVSKWCRGNKIPGAEQDSAQKSKSLAYTLLCNQVLKCF